MIGVCSQDFCLFIHNHMHWQYETSTPTQDAIVLEILENDGSSSQPAKRLLNVPPGAAHIPHISTLEEHLRCTTFAGHITFN